MVVFIQHRSVKKRPSFFQHHKKCSELLILPGETRVRSCDRSTFIRCTPILIWSFSKESAIWTILIREKPNLSQNDGRELCMPQKQRNPSFWFIQTIFQNFSNISNILKNSLKEPKTQISLLSRYTQLSPIILSRVRLFSD